MFFITTKTGSFMMKSLSLQIVLCLLSFYFTGSFTISSAAGEPILIGATVSLEGKFEEPSLMIQQSYKMWEEEINQKGGLLGRKVKLILYDDKSNPDLAAQLYRKLIEEDKVDLVFSPTGTPLTLAASELSEQFGYTMVACASAGHKPWQRGYKYLFSMFAPAERMFIGVLDLMATQGYKTISMVYDETSSFNLDTVRGVQQWADKFMMKVSFKRGYKKGNVELPGIIDELKKINPDGVILAAYSPDCYEFLRQLSLRNYRPKVIAMPIAPSHPDFSKNAGVIANKVFGPSQWEPDERIPFPGTRNFITKFKDFTGRMPSYHAGSAYAACQLYEQSINTVQSLDNNKIRNYIAALDTVTVIGRFKVDSTGKQVRHNVFNIQWQNGKKEIVWPSKMRTAKPLL